MTYLEGPFWKDLDGWFFLCNSFVTLHFLTRFICTIYIHAFSEVNRLLWNLLLCNNSFTPLCPLFIAMQGRCLGGSTKKKTSLCLYHSNVVRGWVWQRQTETEIIDVLFVFSSFSYEWESCLSVKQPSLYENESAWSENVISILVSFLTWSQFLSEVGYKLGFWISLSNLGWNSRLAC